jgi:isoquinoline 1-oxidoreductase subunit beta
MAISRRAFLASGAAAAGGLVIGIQFVQAEEGEKILAWPHASTTDFQPNAFIQVTPDNRVILQIHKQEMGQGIMTGLTTIVAEELYMSPESIVREFSGVHKDFNNPMFNLMLTNASSSIITCYKPVREAAASVRMVLLQSAAKQLKVPVKELRCDQAVIYHDASGRKVEFGALVDLAKTLPMPEKLEFTPANDYRYVGKINGRLEAAAKVNGSVKYGIDLGPEDALVATVAYCPHFGGKVKSFNADRARKMKGVVNVVEIEHGVAVVATNYWYAQQAEKELDIEWDPGEFGNESSESIATARGEILDKGEADSAYSNTEGALVAEYIAPYMAYMTMEPLNATVWVKGERAEVWLGSQAPDVAGATAAHGAGIPVENVTVHSTFTGGGFGRKNFADPHVRDAAQLSRHTGKPVKVILSREKDVQNSSYRPAVTCRLYSSLDGDKVTAWRYRLCTPSMNYNLMQVIRSAIFPHSMPKSEVKKIAQGAMKDDHENIESALELNYKFGDKKVDQHFRNGGVPIFFWRSVGNSFNGFFIESFVDEMADKAGMDPLEFRLKHLDPKSKSAHVLKLVAEKAKWGVNEPGRFKGIAFEFIKNAYVGMVAEISIDNGQINVHKVVAAVDVGMRINPDIVNTIIESCIVWGMSACLHDAITIKDGSVQQSNFHDFSVSRMDQAPVMEIHQVDSDRDPVGAGECAVGPVAPAIANAVFQATGKRLRSLPLKV